MTSLFMNEALIDGSNKESVEDLSVKFTVIVERDEDGYFIASVPELPGCHTQAKDLGVLMERIKEAITLYLETKGVSAEEKVEVVGVQFVEVPTE